MYDDNTPGPFHPPAEVVHDLSEGGISNVPTILLVEDEVEMVEVLRAYLCESSFHVLSAKDGVAGVKSVMENKIDVILCDMMMPRLPGDMFYRAIERVRPELCRRFIFMTGHKGDPKIDGFVRSVKGLILYKPFEPHLLLESISAVLRK